MRLPYPTALNTLRRPPAEDPCDILSGAALTDRSIPPMDMPKYTTLPYKCQLRKKDNII